MTINQTNKKSKSKSKAKQKEEKQNNTRDGVTHLGIR
jgi:hypothetical protein